MDWMRLVKQNPNLNGLGGQPQRSDISMDEVRRHNTKEDAWMVFNGMVRPEGGAEAGGRGRGWRAG